MLTTISAVNADEISNESRGLVTLSYIHNTTEKLKRVLQRYNLQVAVKPVQKLGQVLTKVKDKVPMEKQTGIVYTIPCSDCDMQCVRETGRALQTRKRGHERSVKQQKVEQSALAEHVKHTGHNINWDNMRPLLRESRWCQKDGVKHALF